MSDNNWAPIASPAERVAMGKEAQRSEGAFHRKVETTDTKLVPTWEIIQGDALKLLGGFSPGTFDAIITDPPYASGGRTQAEKNKSTAKKYSSMGDHAPPPFEGDAKDQRSWTRWAAEWLADARKLCKPGAPVCMFIDWRQLPAATDALPWAG